MKIVRSKVLTYDVVNEVAADMGLRTNWKKGANFRLRPGEGDEFFDFNAGNPQVCYHGQKEFLRRLYILDPRACIRTYLTTYTSVGNFYSQMEDVDARASDLWGEPDCMCDESSG